MSDIDPAELMLPNEVNRFEGRHIDDILAHGFRLGASDITIQTGEKVMIELMGRLRKITRHDLTNSEVSDLINGIYGPNGTTQILRGEDLDTHYEIRPSRNERFRFRVNGTGCTVKGHHAIQVTARTIPIEPPHIDSMNLPQEIIDASAPKDGVVYITGATGSGKSTLLAAMMRNLIEDPEANRKILTYESPIEFVYDTITTPTAMISQSEIPKHLPSFAAGVRNALRRKPHGLLVGECRDSDTISAVLEAALTGHPVYTTLHSNGVAETIRRLVGSFDSADRAGKTIDIIETLRVIIWQQLVPTTDGKRMPLREYLVFNEAIRDELLECDLDHITAASRSLLKKYGQPMSVDVERAYEQGKITERLYKVLRTQGH